MIKVSIIIPVFNVAKFLPRCLDSLINQTLKDIEIICINDGSTDNGLEILKNYAKKDSRIQIINKENEGVSCARNDGMQIAQGEYTGFVDSDDWIDLDFYEKLYSSAKKYNADIAIASIKRSEKNKKNRDLFLIEKEEIREDAEDKINHNTQMGYYVWNRIYKASELKKHNIIFEPERNHEDICFTAQALIKLKRTVYVPNTYYYYFKNKNSIVQKKTKKTKNDCEYAFHRMMEILEKNNIRLYTGTKRYKIFGLTYLKKTYTKTTKTISIFNCINFTRTLKRR